ncbi:hypothetical protein WJX72_007467 [[Myrmecia] bisecta]|uniref:NB-ARC domain-containing protein n=1 Tax=[Myrmecia] bisecta TaxID=41462 RepID=A0AAW1PU44_9CHLO
MPAKDLPGLHDQVVKACGGLPLTLKVLGTYLKGKRSVIWGETLERLRHARDLPGADHEKVFLRLRISYDGLDWVEQQMFLDVACLLLGRSAAAAKRAWAGSKWPSEAGLDVLTGRSLVTVDEDGRLAMHDQLRDLGRAIEARGPGMQQDLPITERKRLWLSDDEQLKLIKKASGALPNLAGLHATAYCSHLAVLDLRGSHLDSLTDKLPASLQELDLGSFYPDDVVYRSQPPSLPALSEKWSQRDAHFCNKSAYFTGARMLQQDPVECLFQFVCSSNNYILRIHGMVECLAPQQQSAAAAKVPGLAFCAFPTLEQLSKATEADLRANGFGYRAKFILGSVAALLEKPGGGCTWLRRLRTVPDGRCICDAIPAQFKHLGHVYTADAGFISIQYPQAHHLLGLAKLGTHHRIQPCHTVDAGLRSKLRSSIDEQLRRYADKRLVVDFGMRRDTVNS